MEVVSVDNWSYKTSKLQSNHHHQQTNTPCFTGRMSFLSTNQQCQSTEGKKSHYCTTRHISGTLLIIIIIMVLSQQHKLLQRPSIHVNVATRRPSIYKSFVFRLVSKCLTYYCASSTVDTHLAVLVTCLHSHNDNIFKGHFPRQPRASEAGGAMQGI